MGAFTEPTQTDREFHRIDRTYAGTAARKALTRGLLTRDDAYERLSQLKGPSNMSFSEVILKYTPQKKKLSEILKEFGPNPALAGSVAEASRDMRKVRRVSG